MNEDTIFISESVRVMPNPEADPNWKCYLFGNKPGGSGMVYTPAVGQVPNWFVRWMMRVCLGCMWVRKP